MRSSVRVLLALAGLALLSAQGCLAGLSGAWVAGATPATLRPRGASVRCTCAPDPILPNPDCILCACFGNNPYGSTNNTVDSKAKRTCDLPVTTPTRMAYATGATASCGCAKDPFLSGKGWVLCKCPPTQPKANPMGIPTVRDYSRWPVTNYTSPSISEWPRCGGAYALCSSANCTLNFKGRSSSGVMLAECGCIIPTKQNGLKKQNFVDPTYILSRPLYDAYAKKCPDNAKSPDCRRPDSTPICRAIAKNTIYGGKYDYISTFATSPQVGGFNKLCLAPSGKRGLYAQCMTAACYKRKAFDGSPITCYCPVYRAEKYLVGSPVNVTDTCKPTLPYILSGVAADFGGR